MIEVKHSDDLDAQGLFDSSEVIQYLTMEDNPVGRVKRMLHFLSSPNLRRISTQSNCSIWEEAIPFETASMRLQRKDC